MSLSVNKRELVNEYSILMYNAAIASGALLENSSILSIGLGPGSLNGYIHDLHKNVSLIFDEYRKNLKKFCFSFKKNTYYQISINRILLITFALHIISCLFNFFYRFFGVFGELGKSQKTIDCHFFLIFFGYALSSFLLLFMQYCALKLSLA